MHSDFFQGKTDKGLFYSPNHYRQTLLSKQEKEEEKFLQCTKILSVTSSEVLLHLSLTKLHFRKVSGTKIRAFKKLKNIHNKTKSSGHINNNRF
jgi:hypothetical protein